VSTRETLVATASQTVGPFFEFALAAGRDGRMRGRLPAGEAIRLRITVTDGDGQGVTDAMIELSQSGAFGRMATDGDGACEFETVRPISARGSSAASHVAVYVFARGLLRQLHTRIYFADDAALPSDPVLALVPGDRRETLLAHPDPQHPGRWRFDLRLQGPGETVFFDV